VKEGRKEGELEDQTKEEGERHFIWRRERERESINFRV
jgi:hypothetical protein